MKRMFFAKVMVTAIFLGWACISSAADTIRIAYSSINPHDKISALIDRIDSRSRIDLRQVNTAAEHGLDLANRSRHEHDIPIKSVFLK